MLERARALEVQLFVCTSKRRKFANRIVQTFELEHFFTRVFGSEDDGRFDAKSALVRHILQSMKLEPTKTALVGDREHDVGAALANGVTPIGVTYGYGSLEELVEAGANVICRSPAEVAKSLSGSE